MVEDNCENQPLKETGFYDFSWMHHHWIKFKGLKNKENDHQF